MVHGGPGARLGGGRPLGELACRLSKGAKSQKQMRATAPGRLGGVVGEGLWRLQMAGICRGGTLLGCVRRLGGHPERHLGVGGSQWGRRMGSSRACGSSNWQRPRLKVLGRPTCSELSFSLGSLLSRSGCRATWWDPSPTLGFLPRLPVLFPGISMGAHCPPKPAGHGLCVSEPPYPALPRLPVLCGQWSVPLPPFLVGSPASFFWLPGVWLTLCPLCQQRSAPPTPSSPRDRPGSGPSGLVLTCLARGLASE